MHQYIIGCSSTCNNTTPKNGSCSGAGCCQADLPKGVRHYTSFFNEYYNTSEIWRTYPCNYIAVMETAAFNFSTTYLTSTVFYDTDNSQKPVVMEWGIARNSCAEAKNDTATYACVSNNSDCVTNEAGYHCRCSGGYQGNPYIVDGCKGVFNSSCSMQADYFSYLRYIYTFFSVYFSPLHGVRLAIFRY